LNQIKTDNINPSSNPQENLSPKIQINDKTITYNEKSEEDSNNKDTEYINRESSKEIELNKSVPLENTTHKIKTNIFQLIPNKLKNENEKKNIEKDIKLKSNLKKKSSENNNNIPNINIIENKTIETIEKNKEEKEENFFTKLKSNLISGASIFAIKINNLFQKKKKKNNNEDFQFSNINLNNTYLPLSIILITILIVFTILKFVYNYNSKNSINAKNEDNNNFNKNKNKEIRLPNRDRDQFDNYNNNKENNYDENVIVLKGRTKKIPRSLNYNELFINNVSDKKHNKKVSEKKNKEITNYNNNNNYLENQEKEEDKISNSNYEDFFDKINENKKILEIINQAKNIDNK
jgi:hypothetical protein